MYDYIRGRMISKSPTHIIIESAGIGYFINIPLSTYDKIPDQGDAKIFTQMFIREELMTMFGFATIDERSIFRLLISISGIGPKIALAILSGSPLNDFKEAIIKEDVNTIKKIKGIGKKTAERIVLELKGAMKDVSQQQGSKEEKTENNQIEDAVMALVSLGYVRATAEKAVDNALKTFNTEDGIEALVRLALKNTS